MDASLQFPGDENGGVLRRMFDDGDDLSEPRMLDFCFAFPERKQALSFAELVDERELEVCDSDAPRHHSIGVRLVCSRRASWR